MEFVEASELDGILEDNGLAPGEPIEDCIFLDLTSAEAVRFHVATEGSELEPAPGASVHTAPAAQLAEVLDGILHRLHADQVIIVPVSEWGGVFDAVAFSLAENEDWQELDAAATVERNTRDPILCGPSDFGMIKELVTALCEDADSMSQTIQFLFPAIPLVIDLVPTGVLRVTCGTQVIADEVVDVLPSA